ncbi:hypothetical protein CCMSSC00406_0008598 [Pleurotus cornucopiae]|uniref:Uncharacterized protein n=1 Tax=Pleurotus cornucopiae TaxID=5321 RepID=A0ACB7IHV1_PLECO|nr:hypothetical protein CCMSSC00406_0008598 [Pleurotus cornucopiae]
MRRRVVVEPNPDLEGERRPGDSGDWRFGDLIIRTEGAGEGAGEDPPTSCDERVEVQAADPRVRVRARGRARPRGRDQQVMGTIGRRGLAGDEGNPFEHFVESVRSGVDVGPPSA